MTFCSDDEQSCHLRTIYFYLSDGCNLACRHCWIAPTYNIDGQSFRSLELDLFRSIIKQAEPLGLDTVKLTGGEPLLHPQIHEIIEIVNREDLRLNVETNGVLCTPELAEAISRGRDAFISISLDGAKAETHEWIRGVPGCFDKALRGLSNLVKVGLKPQLIMCLMKRNKDQIKDLVNLAETFGAGSVKFSIVSPTARGETLHKQGETLPIEDLVAIGFWLEHTLSGSTCLKIFPGHPLAFRPLKKLFGDYEDGCGICGIKGVLGVLADGSYALCGIGETVPELVFGHAATDKLADIWSKTPLLQEIRKGLPDRLEGICSNCIMKWFCQGHCIAQNYYTNKNIWSPFWYCAEAQKAGIFPKNRIISI